MRAPYSSATNAAYGVAGLLLAEEGGALVAAYVGSCLFLAVGSGLYHRIGGKWNQALDEIAMYAVVLSLLAAGLAPTFGAVPALAGGFALWFLCAVFFDSLDSHTLVPILAVLASVLVGIRGTLWQAAFVLVVFALAGGVRFLGERFSGTRFGDLLHGAWHVLTAAVIWYSATVLLP